MNTTEWSMNGIYNRGNLFILLYLYITCPTTDVQELTGTVRIGYVYHTYMKQKTLYPIFLKPDTGSCNFFTVSMNTFRIFAQNKNQWQR